MFDQRNTGCSPTSSLPALLLEYHYDSWLKFGYTKKWILSSWYQFSNITVYHMITNTFLAWDALKLRYHVPLNLMWLHLCFLDQVVHLIKFSNKRCFVSRAAIRLTISRSTIWWVDAFWTDSVSTMEEPYAAFFLWWAFQLVFTPLRLKLDMLEIINQTPELAIALVELEEGGE